MRGPTNYGRRRLAQVAAGGIAHWLLTRPARARDCVLNFGDASARVNASQAEWRRLPPTPMLPFFAERSEFVSVGDTMIFFAEFGRGPPILMLHGGMANSNYWGHQVRALACDFKVIVMDTRGHGRSPATPPPFTYKLFAEDALKILDFLKVPDATIIGWSDGAVSALQLALRSPSRVKKLIVYGANTSAAGLRSGGSKTGAFPSFINRCKGEYTRLSPHSERFPLLANNLRRLWRSDPNLSKEELTNINAPTMVADGEFDEIIKPEHTAFIADAIPRAQLRFLPGTSHFAMLQNPDLFTNTIREFIDA
jgi:pimeloyl-ACP methyl ester carboxylesterase